MHDGQGLSSHAAAPVAALQSTGRSWFPGACDTTASLSNPISWSTIRCASTTVPSSRLYPSG